MTLPLIFFGLFMGIVGPQNVQISDVPKPVDPALEGRSRLCPNASAEGGVSRSNDTRASIKRFTALFEPLIILVMGIMVGALILSMLLAITSINDVAV